MLQENGVWSAVGASREVFSSKVETGNCIKAVKNPVSTPPIKIKDLETLL